MLRGKSQVHISTSVFDGEELPTLSCYPVGCMLLVQVLSLTHLLDNYTYLTCSQL
ncbi:hypothetical protein SERLA73DRAFT_173739 [Serpula lacrymans var. lacrymans S7.3]|uniref:Uncharacterized protein n=2 Tax=Serpula lacrymans var. lacrymans TaxID=341189 RepID=F8PGK8_SERL3|nr:uncharacterized protein SERLADRAFT_454604 [Serpula lacrymans var. lacrymans S7.9]EGO04352.1 hypothetical protein SERLA73DRAFT_173739 [Serpula lacrymans var. lacrymans S7.3]EGO30261.1 hypothetical protein SERLADRAFT_454604 [Serpula lacrymans var. lacrymans S7.9]